MRATYRAALAAGLTVVTVVVSAQIADELIPNLPMTPQEPERFNDMDSGAVPADQLPPGRMLPDERAFVRNTNAAALGAQQGPLNAVQPIPQRGATQELMAAPAANVPPSSTLPPPSKSEIQNATQAPVVDSVRILEQRLPTITKEDLAPLNPVIQQAPGWLKTQERLDVQHYVHLRALERESELAKLRADIATEEKRTRAALTNDDDRERGRSSLGGGLRSRDIDPEDFEQLSQLANLLPAVRGGQSNSAPVAPTPPPVPPKLLFVSGESARIEVDGQAYTASVGDTLAGRYKLESVDFSAVKLREGSSTMTLYVNW